MQTMPDFSLLPTLGGPGRLDKIEVELSESSAFAANDTSVWSIGDF